MFKRTITTFLESWKNQDRRKPLILRGARQVGKTTVVKNFGQRFDHFLYFNLELRQDRQLFEQDLPIQSLIQSLLLHKKITRRVDENLLIFIDEIQYSGSAIAMLRYFYEEHPEIHVISAGSLLETLLDTHSAFPVGRVEYAYIYPVTFEEFLDASDESMLLELLQNEVPVYAHDKLLDLFHLYTMIGGMPEVVSSFLKNRDWIKLTPIYDSLLLSYQDDVEKYAENTKQATLLRHVISHAPFQAGNRITFQNFGQSNYGSREMSEAFRILEKVFLIKLIYPTTAVEAPFEPNHKKSPRLQFLDTGLINFTMGLHSEFFKLHDLNNLYQGKISEHIVGQQLLAHYHKLLFWIREKPQSNAEIDFVIPNGMRLIPIEIKSGKTGTLRSLHSFVQRTEDDVTAIRLYSGKYSEELLHGAGKPFKLLNIPYYLSGQLPRIITEVDSGRIE